MSREMRELVKRLNEMYHPYLPRTVGIDKIKRFMFRNKEEFYRFIDEDGLPEGFVYDRIKERRIRDYLRQQLPAGTVVNARYLRAEGFNNVDDFYYELAKKDIMDEHNQHIDKAVNQGNALIWSSGRIDPESMVRVLAAIKVIRSQLDEERDVHDKITGELKYTYNNHIQSYDDIINFAMSQATKKDQKHGFAFNFKLAFGYMEVKKNENGELYETHPVIKAPHHNETGNFFENYKKISNLDEFHQLLEETISPYNDDFNTYVMRAMNHYDNSSVCIWGVQIKIVDIEAGIGCAGRIADWKQGKSGK